MQYSISCSHHLYLTSSWLSCFIADFSPVRSLSHVQLFVTPWTAACQASLSITNSQILLKLMSIELVMPSNHLILCRPLPLLPSIFPSIRVFSSESVLRTRWPKYWSFSFSISSALVQWILGLISLRIDLLSVQGTLSHVWMWELDCKESWVPKNWCFWTVVLEKTLESSWTARRSNQSILKEVSPGCSLEGLMLKLKLQYFGHLMRRADSL